jgi:outer membrane receptor protein involved in Fe transport
LLSSTQTAGVLSAAANEMTTRVVLPEIQNHYEFGIQQQLGQHLRIDAVRYIKNIRNFSDEEQLLTSGIVFPVSIAKADVRGTELRLDVFDLHGFRAYASYANARAVITTPITGGLFLNDEEEGEEAAFGIAGVTLPADQDERNELHFGTTYSHKSGMWIGMGGRYDSGVPTHFDTREYFTFDPAIQGLLDPTRQRIKPRTILNLAGGIKLFRESANPVSFQVSINNLFDRFYLYNFRSVFSGTHLGRPREMMVRMTVDWGK